MNSNLSIIALALALAIVIFGLVGVFVIMENHGSNVRIGNSGDVLINDSIKHKDSVFSLPVCDCSSYSSDAISDPSQPLYCHTETLNDGYRCHPFKGNCFTYGSSYYMCLGEYRSYKKNQVDISIVSKTEDSQSSSTESAPSKTLTSSSKKQVVSYEMCDNEVTRSLGDGFKKTLQERFAWGFSFSRFQNVQTSIDALVAKATEAGWIRFDFFGQVIANCPTLKSLGNGDEEKRICWDSRMDKENQGCIVYSFGSNNQYDFELNVVRQTKCSIQIFDCTVTDVRMPPEVAARSVFNKICLDKTTYKDASGRQFMKYRDVVKLVGSAPTYLKMDIEGFEYNVFSSILSDDSDADDGFKQNIFPDQIAVEFHYNYPGVGTLTGPAFYALAQTLFLKGGFVLAHRRDNIYCPSCVELLLVRVLCPSAKE